jgi:hypothetical protein
MSTLDMSMIQLDRSNGAMNVDKIAEAEALASEALRMANEARRAAERLAEVKATLAMFSKQLENVEKKPMVMLQEVQKTDSMISKAEEIAEATLVVSAPSLAQPKPETPLRKKVDAPVKTLEEDMAAGELLPVVQEEEPAKNGALEVDEPASGEVIFAEEEAAEEPVALEEDADAEDIKKVLLIAPRQPSKKVTIKETPVVMNLKKAESVAPRAIVISPEDEVDKDFFEAALDSMGLDRACGVDDATVYAALATDAKVVIESKKQEIVEDKSNSPSAVESSSKKTTSPSYYINMIMQSVHDAQNSDKDLFEAALDSMGLDKVLGLDDSSLGFAKSVVVVAEQESAPKVAPPALKKAAVASVPKKTPVAAPTTAVVRKQIEAVEEEDEDRDMLEAALDSIGLDKFCGIDDVALGFALPKIEAPPEPVVVLTPLFENPTKITYDVPTETIIPDEIVRSESWHGKLSKKAREERQLPQKYQQKSPTNNDFRDPFGVDHDALAFCGAIADVCEPNLDRLDDTVYYAPISYEKKETVVDELVKDAPVTEEEVAVENEIFVEETLVKEAPLTVEDTVAEEEIVDEEVTEEVKDETPEAQEEEEIDETVSGADPEGVKTDEDQLYDEVEESAISSEREFKISNKQRVQYFIEDQDREVLRLVDQHIWCV